MTDPALASRTLAGIKKLGVRVAMDDFGTGYSSLGYLNQLPLDEVKIDRSFISRLMRDPQTSAIVRAAVDLSHALGLDAVAEGVEDAATMERLVLLGCDRVQGYFIARPMPADAVLPWLQRYVPIAPTAVTAPVNMLIPTATVHDANTSTVLVVDDEASLRVATHRILSSQGYNVLHAATASEALRICTEQRGAIDLVVTDIFLTDWRGHELAGRIREMQPDAKFLFVSGDPMATKLAQGRTLPGEAVLEAAADRSRWPGAGMSRILIVDDDPHLGRSVERVLAHEGHICHVALDPVSATAAATEFKPDLILIELQPGYAPALPQLRTAVGAVPFVFMAGHQDEYEGLGELVGPLGRLVGETRRATGARRSSPYGASPGTTELGRRPRPQRCRARERPARCAVPRRWSRDPRSKWRAPPEHTSVRRRTRARS